MIVVTLFIVLTTLSVYVLAVVSPWGETDHDPEPHEPFFVLLVPALNEERVIGKTIASLLELRGRFLAIVVDDGSDDGTVATVAPFPMTERVRQGKTGTLLKIKAGARSAGRTGERPSRWVHHRGRGRVSAR